MKSPNSQGILDKLFAYEVFKDVDTAELIQQFENSNDLRNAAAPSGQASPTVQTGRAIASIPPEGIIITTSGIYTLSSDIAWEAAEMDCSAITIQANNVVLEMNDHVLEVVSANKQLKIQAITVLAGTNVTVQNGTVKGPHYYGVACTSVIGLNIRNVNVIGLRYENFTIPKVTPCGIFVDQSTGINIVDCTVKDLQVTSASCAGIQIVESVNGMVSNCLLDGFVNGDGAAQGYSYLLSINIYTFNCRSSDFHTHYLGKTNTTGHTCIGYCPIFCWDLHYVSCSSSDMTGCCDDSHGLSVFLDGSVKVIDFSARNIIDGVTPKNTGAKTTGLEVYGVDVTLDDCSAENIIAIVPQDRQSAGFSANGSGIRFINCRARNVQVTGADQQPSLLYGYGTGFGWAPDPRVPFCKIPADTVQYIDCTSTDCQLGFDTWFHTNSSWINVKSTDCGTNMLIQPDTATRTLSIDKCSESPSGNPETVTIQNIAANNTYVNVE